MTNVNTLLNNIRNNIPDNYTLTNNDVNNINILVENFYMNEDQAVYDAFNLYYLTSGTIVLQSNITNVNNYLASHPLSGGSYKKNRSKTRKSKTRKSKTKKVRKSYKSK